MADLICPACEAEGAPGRIGNRRKCCHLCNAFAQRVLRRTAKDLRARHPKEWDRLAAQAERTLYAEAGYRSTVGR